MMRLGLNVAWMETALKTTEAKVSQDEDIREGTSVLKAIKEPESTAPTPCIQMTMLDVVSLFSIKNNLLFLFFE